MFKLNETVAAYVDGGDRITGKITEVLSPTVYEVTTEDGTPFELNAKSMRKLKLAEKALLWVNVYAHGFGGKVFKTKAEADIAAGKSSTPRTKLMALKETKVA